MWSSRMFWKLFLVSAGLIVLAVGACIFFVTRWQETQLLERVRDRLRQGAQLVRDEFGGDFEELDQQVLQEQISKTARYMDSRLTITDAVGRVLADSARQTLAEVNQQENQKYRKEYVDAVRQGWGESTTRDGDGEGPAISYALAIKQGDELVGFVRVSRQLETLSEQVVAVEKVMASVGFGVTLAGMLAAYWLTARLVSPIHQLTAAAEAIAAGDFRRRIPLDAQDEFGMLARSFTTMSERLAAREAQLRDSIQRHTTVLSGMTEGVLAVDTQSKVLFANAAAGDKLQFKPEAVIGTPLLEVVRNHELREIVSRCQRDNKPVESDLAWQTPSKHLHLHVRAAPLSSDSLLGVVLVLQDVSDIKRLEGVRQQFMSNVSHELKTPLSSIKAYTETLLLGDLEDKQLLRHFLGRIDEQATRLNELILDLLSLARIESGQAVLELTKIDLLRVIAMSLDSHEQRAESAGIEFVRPEVAGKIQVVAEEESLRQIIDNLVDNAIKYTPPGGKITVRCFVDTDAACFEVVDTGCGIAPEHHTRLFERFYRVDKARSRELGGTGLGLAIVKHLCQAMRGSVRVASKIGEGSVFTVRLPLAEG